MMTEHAQFMEAAIAQARRGAEQGEQPFGAVVVSDGSIVGRAYSKKMSEPDVTAHAETLALRAATRAVGSRDLSGCVLYTTCEPCPMCAGAALNAHIQHLVFGARVGDLPALEGQALAFGTYSVESFARLTGWELKISARVLGEECVALYQNTAGLITR